MRFRYIYHRTGGCPGAQLANRVKQCVPHKNCGVTAQRRHAYVLCTLTICIRGGPVAHTRPRVLLACSRSVCPSSPRPRGYLCLQRWLYWILHFCAINGPCESAGGGVAVMGSYLKIYQVAPRVNTDEQLYRLLIGVKFAGWCSHFV